MPTPISWTEIAGRIAPHRNVWLATVDPHGAPHTSPVWVVVVREVVYFYTSRATVKGRNLAVNPRVALNLEAGDDVLLVRGTAEPLGHPSGDAEVIAAFAAKYVLDRDRQYVPDDPGTDDVLYAIRPESASTWTLVDYETSQRRWHR